VPEPVYPDLHDLIATAIPIPPIPRRPTRVIVTKMHAWRTPVTFTTWCTPLYDVLSAQTAFVRAG